MKLDVTNQATHGRKGQYQSSELEVQLPDHDCDVTLLLPGGRPVICQWRTESGTIDICLPEPCTVHNWKGADMEPANPLSKKGPHIRTADQLCIDIGNAEDGVEQPE